MVIIVSFGFFLGPHDHYVDITFEWQVIVTIVNQNILLIIGLPGIAASVEVQYRT